MNQDDWLQFCTWLRKMHNSRSVPTRCWLTSSSVQINSNAYIQHGPWCEARPILLFYRPKAAPITSVRKIYVSDWVSSESPLFRNALIKVEVLDIL